MGTQFIDQRASLVGFQSLGPEGRTGRVERLSPRDRMAHHQRMRNNAVAGRIFGNERDLLTWQGRRSAQAMQAGKTVDPGLHVFVQRIIGQSGAGDQRFAALDGCFHAIEHRHAGRHSLITAVLVPEFGAVAIAFRRGGSIGDPDHLRKIIFPVGRQVEHQRLAPLMAKGDIVRIRQLLAAYRKNLMFMQRPDQCPQGFLALRLGEVDAFNDGAEGTGHGGDDHGNTPLNFLPRHYSFASK